MRYFDERLLPLGLILALSACGLGGGVNRPQQALAPATHGPGADFPMVLGEPFTVDGVLYTPRDTMNFDEVGYAALDPEGGTAISAAHRTLPLPSYIEVTSLETGRTILVRAERRGPMTGARMVALSPGAMQQLGASEGTPVRVRRVNPPEIERAKLRSGGMVPERMDTPQSLVDVLKRRLPKPVPDAAGEPRSTTDRVPDPVEDAISAADEIKAEAGAPVPAAADDPQDMAMWDMPGEGPDQAAPAPEAQAPPIAAVPQQSAPSPTAARPFVVQAGAFANKANAENVARAIGGTIDLAGNLYRVRTGPFADRAEAEVSLAKVRAKGYSGARIYAIR